MMILSIKSIRDWVESICKDCEYQIDSICDVDNFSLMNPIKCPKMFSIKDFVDRKLKLSDEFWKCNST